MVVASGEKAIPETSAPCSAFTSGPREEVVPFFDRGLSVEYELARALQVVSEEKKKVGTSNTEMQKRTSSSRR